MKNKDMIEEKLMDISNTADLLVDLKRKMQIVNWLFHFTRNNARSRNSFYFALIRIVGYDKWPNLEKRIRLEWESSRNSFDRMYGMVKEFCSGRKYYAELFSKTAVENAETLNDRLEALEKRVDGIKLSPIKKNMDKMSRNIGELEKNINRAIKRK